MKIKAPSFADLFAETSPQLGGARRTKFLETLDRIIPWQVLIPCVRRRCTTRSHAAALSV